MRRTTAWRAVGLTGAVAVIGAGMSGLATAAASPASISPASVEQGMGTVAGQRDPLRWPFARTSIWNTPLGSHARYMPARIRSTGFGVDVDWFVVTRAQDRGVPVYVPPSVASCAGGAAWPPSRPHSQTRRHEHLPRGLVIPGAVADGRIGTARGVSAAFLQPDGRTLVSYSGTARCTPGGPLYGVFSGTTSLYGSGIAGGEGGSGMSSIGGSLRAGELTGTAPIRHALKLAVPARYLAYDAATGGRRWPALHADPDASRQYRGSVPEFRMGALLALPPTATAQHLGVTSTMGRAILTALRDYGAYVVDQSARDAVDLSVEHHAVVDFAKRTGHAVAADPGLRADMPRIVRALAVVDDNEPSSIGGHGPRRAAWAPPFRPAGSPTSTSGTAKGTSEAGASRSSTSAIDAARVADVETPGHAPPTAVVGIAAGAVGLLLVGLWSGRRLLGAAGVGGRQR